MHRGAIVRDMLEHVEADGDVKHAVTEWSRCQIGDYLDTSTVRFRIDVHPDVSARARLLQDTSDNGGGSYFQYELRLVQRKGVCSKEKGKIAMALESVTLGAPSLQPPTWAGREFSNHALASRAEMLPCLQFAHGIGSTLLRKLDRILMCGYPLTSVPFTDHRLQPLMRLQARYHRSNASLER